VLATRSYSLRAALAATVCVLSSSVFSSSLAQAAPQPTGNGAIFFHPDGTSASHWDITRILHYGPDGFLNWDRLPVITTYRGHLFDQLGGTSNAGAVTHATGTRAHAKSFGSELKP
jgi:alkaline phosphatase